MTDNQHYQDVTGNDENERRKFFRLDMEKELIDIVWDDGSGEKVRQRIVCVDFSKGGLRVACRQVIPLNTEVQVCFKAADENSQMLLGRVIRQIEQADGCFEMALRLVDQ